MRQARRDWQLHRHRQQRAHTAERRAAHLDHDRHDGDVDAHDHTDSTTDPDRYALVVEWQLQGVGWRLPGDALLARTATTQALAERSEARVRAAGAALARYRLDRCVLHFGTQLARDGTFRPPKTEAGRRVLPVPAFAIEVLHEHRRVQDQERAVASEWHDVGGAGRARARRAVLARSRGLAHDKEIYTHVTGVMLDQAATAINEAVTRVTRNGGSNAGSSGRR